MTALQGSFACKAKYLRHACAYLQGSYWQKKRIYYENNPNCCSLGHKKINMCFNWYKITGQNQIQTHPMIFHLPFQLMYNNSDLVIQWSTNQLNSLPSHEQVSSTCSHFQCPSKSLEKFKTDHKTRPPGTPTVIPTQPCTFPFGTKQCCLSFS